MKILFVGASYPPLGRGGTEAHMQDLARALAAEGHRVSVFCRRWDPSQPEFAVATERVDGVSVHRVNFGFTGVSSLPELLDVPSLDERFVSVLDAEDVDLVHVHHLTGLSFGILDRVSERGLPLVMTLHDHWCACFRGQRITPELRVCEDLDRSRCAPCLQALWPHFGIDEETLHHSDAEILRRLGLCDLLLTPSEFHRVKMVEFGLPGERIRVIPHGLDHDRIPPREPRKVPPSRIGFIGSLIPSKGVQVLLEAFALLGRDDLELHLHGEAVEFHGDGGYLDRLKAQIPAASSVTIHGAYDREELPRILNGLDIVVVPSLWWESFCLTIREALLGGVPPLASDLGAMHEALAPLGEDLLFRPGDAQDLCYKIDALLGDPERYARLTRLRGEVRSLGVMASDTLAAYREIAGDPDLRREESRRLEELKRRGNEKPYVTVFVPTWNGGPLFERVLDRILEQSCDFDYEVLCIDSGSEDGTVEVIGKRPRVRLIQIPNSEFNHGATRNRAIREAQGEIVALLTQDAMPIDEHWLQSLVDNFDDPQVAGAYCHQLPRENCNPFQRDRLKGWTQGEGRAIHKRLRDPGSWETLAPFDRLHLIAFDDVASCVRKSVMAEVPFAKRQFGEDVDWGKRAILAGHTLVMDPRSVVIHSHNNPIFYEFKRVYLDHQNLHDLVGLHTVPTPWLVARCSTHLLFRLMGQVWRDDRPLGYRLGWLLKTPLYAFTQNFAQYLGAKSASRRGMFPWTRIDRWLRRGV